MLQYRTLIGAMLAVTLSTQAQADSGKVRIDAISLNDTATTVSAALSGGADLGVDVLQNDCDPDPDIESYETFGYLSVRLSLSNTKNKTYKATAYRFTVTGQDGSKYTSPKLSTFLTIPKLSEADESTTTALALAAPINHQKFFLGSSAAITDLLGVAKVKVTVYLKPFSGGKTIKESRSLSVQFADLDRCSN